MSEHLGAIVALCALAFSILTAILANQSRLAMSQMRTALGELELKVASAITKSKEDVEERIDRQGREFGETAQAIRQKITEVELFTRDTFVRRDSFYKATEDITKGVNDLGSRIEKRLERMEGKIDDGKS